MFTNKNKISNQNTYQRNKKKITDFLVQEQQIKILIKITKCFFIKIIILIHQMDSENGMFSSLHKELNNNINSINRQGRMFNSMFQTKRGCGCRGKNNNSK